MIRGSNETDLNSGLEDTMIEAYHAIKETQKRPRLVSVQQHLR